MGQADELSMILLLIKAALVSRTQPNDSEEIKMSMLRSNLLKLSIVVIFCVVIALYLTSGSMVAAFSGGPPPSNTGAPSETTCLSCHTPPGPTGGTLTITGVPANYSPNQEITVTVTLTQSNRARYGFQLTVIDDQGRRAGDLTPGDGRTQTQTAQVAGNERQYINHTTAGNSPSTPGTGSWTFRWRAPAQGVGRITFYAAGNAANGDFTTTGDSIYTTSVNTNINTLQPFTTVSAASFAPDSVFATEAIAAGFGTGLSQNMVPAPSVPLPTELDGTQVQIRDAGNTTQPAPLFIVTPQQINYLIPPGTANGPATVTVLRNGTPFAQGMINVDTIAPALFTANQTGRGVPAAVIFRVRGGQVTSEPLFQLNPTTGQFEAIPIDLGPETDVVILSAFGSGFRNVMNNLAMVGCTIGSVPAQVEFAGANPQFVGLDQANIRIPRSLAGVGNADVIFTVAGKAANTVSITIR
jgi:uncharacterized protein (TIGR03437 family)